MTALLIKALAVLLIAAGFVITLNSQRAEYGFLLSLSAGAVVMLMLLDGVFPQMTKIKTVFDKAGGVSVYFSAALKALGISYITEFAADTCRDFGQTSLAAKAEFAGKCAIFIICVPLITSIIEWALKFADI